MKRDKAGANIQDKSTDPFRPNCESSIVLSAEESEVGAGKSPVSLGIFLMMTVPKALEARVSGCMIPEKKGRF